MKRSRNGKPVADHSDRATRERCLLGPRQFAALLDLVCQFPTPCAPSAFELAEAWRRAAEVYRTLEALEAGAADKAEIRPLPKSLAAHAQAIIDSPPVRKTFDTVPVALGMVALDQIVVAQYSLTESIVTSIRDAFATRPRATALARLCLPLQPGLGEVRLAYRDHSEFVFTSDRHDLRYLGAAIVETPRDVESKINGHAQAVIALSVGYSTNVLNLVHFNGRLVLNNGYHRAYALHAMGVTHVPAIIQACANMDDVEQAAIQEVVSNSDLYFHAPRPPLLRDFDHPELTRAYEVPRQRRQLRVKVEVESRLVAA